MKADKLLGLLGMCRRSGRLTVGFDAVTALCREKQVLLMLAADASPRTVRQLSFQAGETPVYRLPLDREQIAHAIGSAKPIAALATTDPGFIRALHALLTSPQEEESRYDDQISRQ
ncbi:MAG: ribosomal L7Ae/L30e/S12e/Gadd45 family protein [Clostridia bacterium]|nr:ribosomal L7Ae/L30e/S12e/Gadd45 family protein [Clostridia bacterium]